MEHEAAHSPPPSTNVKKKYLHAPSSWYGAWTKKPLHMHAHASTCACTHTHTHTHTQFLHCYFVYQVSSFSVQFFTKISYKKSHSKSQLNVLVSFKMDIIFFKHNMLHTSRVVARGKE